MKQALLVIDAQESFRSRPYFNDAELPGFLANTQSLIDRCQAQGIPVGPGPRRFKAISSAWIVRCRSFTALTAHPTMNRENKSKIAAR